MLGGAARRDLRAGYRRPPEMVGDPRSNYIIPLPRHPACFSRRSPFRLEPRLFCRLSGLPSAVPGLLLPVSRLLPLAVPGLEPPPESPSSFFLFFFLPFAVPGFDPASLPEAPAVPGLDPSVEPLLPGRLLDLEPGRELGSASVSVSVR